NSTTSERHQQYRNWSQKTAMPLSGRSASYSSTNLQKSLVNWLYTWPDLIAQAQSPSITHFSPYKTKADISESINKETLTNLVIEQCKLLFLHTISKEFKTLYKKTCEYFDNFRHTYNKDIASLAKDLLFIASKVWKQKLNKYLDASDYLEFKKFPSSLKSLETFITESLRIHVKYLMAVQDQKNPSYCEDILAKVKKLDQLTY
ncbi:17119_t:CDS:2, partial [Funneliformis caledonium]